MYVMNLRKLGILFNLLKIQCVTLGGHAAKQFTSSIDANCLS